MTDPITTPEQMREAAAQLADLLSGSLMDQHNEAKEYGIFGHGYLRSASDDVLRLATTIRAIPIAPQPDATPAMNDTLDGLLQGIKRKVEEAEADRDRWAHIAATIHVNAIRHGATDAEVEAMVRGELDFITWIADKIETREAAIRAIPVAPQSEATPARDVRAAVQVLTDYITSDMFAANAALSKINPRPEWPMEHFMVTFLRALIDKENNDD